MPSKLYSLLLWIGLFPIKGVSGYFLLLLYFIEIPEFYANSEDPGQTTRCAESDLRVHRLPMFLL